MKTKRFLIVITLLSASIFTLSSCDKEKIISEDKLPTEIVNYVAQHFPENKIIQSVVELDDLTKTYELFLQGGFELKFNRKKEIIDIEGTVKLPDSVVPEKIRQYVETNFPDNFIVGWELDDRNQQVELNNSLDLEFTMAGEFIRIDS